MLEQKLQQLETLLQQQAQVHERVAALLNDKFAALRKADHRALTAVLAAENQQVQLLGELEKHRLILAAELTQALAPQAPAPLKMNELAQRLPEPWRGRLLTWRARLQTQMEQVRQRTAVAQRASKELLQHMQGVMRQLGATLTGTSVYNRHGAPPAAALAVRTFEVRA